MEKILIVEDDQRMRNLVALYLKNAGWQVVEAGDASEAIERFYEDELDLVILDIMLPDKDGWSVCRAIRKTHPTLPIVMLTARKTEDDELFGFELGADEYITKPFNPNILVARVKVALKRVEREESGTLLFPDLAINSTMHKVCYKNREIDLSPREYKLLLYFAGNAGIALHRDQILDHVWGLNCFVNDRVVDTTIKRLRKKLDNRYIKTVRAVGYRFESD